MPAPRVTLSLHRATCCPLVSTQSLAGSQGRGPGRFSYHPCLPSCSGLGLGLEAGRSHRHRWGPVLPTTQPPSCPSMCPVLPLSFTQQLFQGSAWDQTLCQRLRTQQCPARERPCPCNTHIPMGETVKAYISTMMSSNSTLHRPQGGMLLGQEGCGQAETLTGSLQYLQKVKKHSHREKLGLAM